MTGQSVAVGLAFWAPFLLVIAIAAGTVVVAARRTATASDFYVAGGGIGPWRNAFALAGDFVGVGGFFAITGLIALHGADGFVFAIGAMCGFPLMLFLFAEPLKSRGRYTLADLLAPRETQRGLRALIAIVQIVIVLAQLLAQLVGAASLMHLLFGLAEQTTLLMLAAVIGLYMAVGGMLATTWLQMIKAAMMMAIAVLIAVLALDRFGFDPVALLSRAAQLSGRGAILPGPLFNSPIDALSLLAGMALGNASMPHVLMRLNTVPDPLAARRSVFYGTGLIVIFHLLVLLLGYAALVEVGPAAVRTADPGGNMALPLLARALGGDALLGLVSAVALATILAVVAGLMISGSAALSHDLWSRWLMRGAVSARRELIMARLSALALIAVALIASSAVRGVNVGLLSALGYSIGASAIFPVLVLTVFWREMTPAGCVAGVVTGLASSAVLTFLSPVVQVGVLHHASAPLALQTPAVISAPLAFAAAVLGSRFGAFGARRARPAP